LNFNLSYALLIQTVFDLNHRALLWLCLQNRVALLFPGPLVFGLIIHFIPIEWTC
jgi:hypothetical protein